MSALLTTTAPNQGKVIKVKSPSDAGERIQITFQPDPVTTRVLPGTTIFQAAAWLGRPVESTCGGRATCGKCRVRVEHDPPPVTPADQDHLSTADLADGWRLACQAECRTDLVVEVPRLLGTPKTAMVGVGRPVVLDANIHKIHMQLDEPELDDQRAELRRVVDRLRQEGFPARAGLALIRTLPVTLCEAHFDVTAVLCSDHLIALEPGDTTGE